MHLLLPRVGEPLTAKKNGYSSLSNTVVRNCEINGYLDVMKTQF